VIIIKLWFSTASHPTTTSSFLEEMVRRVPLSQPNCLLYSSRSYE